MLGETWKAWQMTGDREVQKGRGWGLGRMDISQIPTNVLL